MKDAVSGVDIIVHEAAFVSVPQSMDEPQSCFDVNITGTSLLFDVARRAGVKRAIVASSAAVYGDSDAMPLAEETPLRPLSPYAVSKLAVEKYLFFFRQTHGLPYVALRYSNVYGPRQDPFGEAGVVAIFCQKMWRNETPTINGQGGQTRDFVYAADVARANLLALGEDVQGEINIATGVETSVNTVFRILREATGATVEERHGPPMPGEQMRSVLDARRAEKVMGWKPRFSIKDGLLLTADFFRPAS